jgi:hypothetical protein
MSIGVVTLSGVGIHDRNYDVRPELGCTSGVEMYDQSRDVDQSQNVDRSYDVDQSRDV